MDSEVTNTSYRNLNITIRKFCIEDYDALIMLWDNTQLPYKPKGRDRRDRIESELKRGNAIFLVAEINGRLIGSILGTYDGRKGWINRLAVSPEFRRQGIAKKLITKVEEYLSELGIEIVACLVEKQNTDSIRVFEKLGYTQQSDIIYLTKRKNPDV